MIHKGAPFPRLDETDWLILLGGPMNVDEAAEFPWLNEEKKYLRTAIDAGKVCLGLCLGGQLLAQTLGAEVRKNDHWEAGWFPIQIVGHGELMVFNFHQDVFELPPGAVRIATNKITTNQAFKFGDGVIGIQFHPESTREWVDSFVEEDPYPTGPFVQQPDELIAGYHYLEPMREWLFGLLIEMEKVAMRAKV